MKKKILIIAVIIVAILLIIFTTFIFTLTKHISDYRNFDYGSLNLSNVADGTYIGSENGSIVQATVKVTVKNHVIKNVEIVSHKCGKGKPAEVIVNDIVKKNSLQVDTVSGATYSSYVIKKAVYNALTKK